MAKNNIKIELNKARKTPTIKVSDYENLFIGFEIECNNISVRNAANLFGITTINHTGGISSKMVKGELPNGGKYELPVPCDKYKEAGIITDVYNDGSVETEVVTMERCSYIWNEGE